MMRRHVATLFWATLCIFHFAAPPWSPLPSDRKDTGYSSSSSSSSTTTTTSGYALAQNLRHMAHHGHDSHHRHHHFDPHVVRGPIAPFPNISSVCPRRRRGGGENDDREAEHRRFFAEVGEHWRAFRRYADWTLQDRPMYQDAPQACSSAGIKAAVEGQAAKAEANEGGGDGTLARHRRRNGRGGGGGA